VLCSLRTRTALPAPPPCPFRSASPCSGPPRLVPVRLGPPHSVPFCSSPPLPYRQELGSCLQCRAVPDILQTTILQTNPVLYTFTFGLLPFSEIDLPFRSEITVAQPTICPYHSYAAVHRLRSVTTNWTYASSHTYYLSLLPLPLPLRGESTSLTRTHLRKQFIYFFTCST